MHVPRWYQFENWWCGRAPSRRVIRCSIVRARTELDARFELAVFQPRRAVAMSTSAAAAQDNPMA